MFMRITKLASQTNHKLVHGLLLISLVLLVSCGKSPNASFVNTPSPPSNNKPTSSKNFQLQELAFSQLLISKMSLLGRSFQWAFKNKTDFENNLPSGCLQFQDEWKANSHTRTEDWSESRCKFYFDGKNLYPQGRIQYEANYSASPLDTNKLIITSLKVQFINFKLGIQKQNYLIYGELVLTPTATLDNYSFEYNIQIDEDTPLKMGSGFGIRLENPINIYRKPLAKQHWESSLMGEVFYFSQQKNFQINTSKNETYYYKKDTQGKVILNTQRALSLTNSSIVQTSECNHPIGHFKVSLQSGPIANNNDDSNSSPETHDIESQSDRLLYQPLKGGKVHIEKWQGCTRGSPFFLVSLGTSINKVINYLKEN